MLDMNDFYADFDDLHIKNIGRVWVRMIWWYAKWVTYLTPTLDDTEAEFKKMMMLTYGDYGDDILALWLTDW